MILDREALRKQLKASQIMPVYLLFGEEAFLRDLAVETITKKVLGDGFSEFDRSVFDVSETKIEDILVAARRLPFGQKHVVEIRNVKIAAVSSKDTLKERDEQLIKEYLEKPSQTSVLIFVAEEFDRRRKLAKLFLEKASVVEFKKLHGTELVAWIKKKFESMQVMAEDSAIELLIRLVGNSLQELSLECEKLATAVLTESTADDPDTERQSISAELIRRLVPDRFVPENFVLADYLLEKNRVKAMETLRKLLDEGVEPTLLLGLIASSFRRIFLIKEMMKKDMDRVQIARIAKIPYHRQEEYFRIARRSDAKRLSDCLIKIAEADLAIKTSRSTPRLQLEILLLELTS